MMFERGWGEWIINHIHRLQAQNRSILGSKFQTSSAGLAASAYLTKKWRGCCTGKYMYPWILYSSIYLLQWSRSRTAAWSRWRRLSTRKRSSCTDTAVPPPPGMEGGVPPQVVCPASPSCLAPLFGPRPRLRESGGWLPRPSLPSRTPQLQHSTGLCSTRSSKCNSTRVDTSRLEYILFDIRVL